MRTPSFSPAQCRAARGLLAWSQDDLAVRAGLELEAVELFEGCDAELSFKDLSRLYAAIYAAGVRPIEADLAGEGVRFRRAGRQPQGLRPRNGFALDPEFEQLGCSARAAAIQAVATRVATQLSIPPGFRSAHAERR